MNVKPATTSFQFTDLPTPDFALSKGANVPITKTAISARPARLPFFAGYGGPKSRKMHVGYTANLSLCQRKFRGVRTPLADFHIGGRNPRCPRFVCEHCARLLADRLEQDKPTFTDVILRTYFAA